MFIHFISLPHSAFFPSHLFFQQKQQTEAIPAVTKYGAGQMYFLFLSKQQI
jgi:hypothetical protein